MNLKILFFIILILLIILGVIFYTKYNWECVSGICKRKFGGKYTSKKDCQRACQNYTTTHKKRLLSERRKRVDDNPEFVMVKN